MPQIVMGRSLTLQSLILNFCLLTSFFNIQERLVFTYQSRLEVLRKHIKVFILWNVFKLGLCWSKNTKTLLSYTHASASFKFIWWEGKENTNQVKVLWIKFFTNEQLQRPHEAKVYIHCKYKSYHSRVSSPLLEGNYFKSNIVPYYLYYKGTRI